MTDNLLIQLLTRKSSQMLSMLTALIMVMFCVGIDARLDGLSSYFPSNKEFERAISNAPYSDWGKQARAQNSLRVLAIGGSNTIVHANEGHGFVLLLKSFLQKHLLNSTSSVINNGECSRGPSYFIGKVIC
jgi:hypothetical protein